MNLRKKLPENSKMSVVRTIDSYFKPKSTKLSQQKTENQQYVVYQRVPLTPKTKKWRIG